MRLLTDFVGHVRRLGLLRPGDRVVVACSGGGDSVALAALVARSAKRLSLGGVTLAHLDHALRPESGKDAEFVAAFAHRLDVACIVERHEIRRRRGESPEAAARRVRYAFLERVARKAGARVVLTAHHMDDQAETVLLRALRGTGPRGLRGILPDRAIRRGSVVRVVRPLLAFRRERLRDWLRRWRISWVEDPTNVAGNVRARLRNEAMPVLAACTGRDPVPLLARLADHVRLPHSSPSVARMKAGVAISPGRTRPTGGRSRGEPRPTALRAPVGTEG